MKISIHFKTQSHAIVTRGPYEIDPEEFEQLKRNFLSFVEQGTPKGGS
ncbi:MAG: hypothetical protein AAGB97_05320 [Dehalococcoidia bacterium]|nr:hypothetical protein [Chloroflexota bacterium]MBT9162502.1 hypothetical protein [Chloroflexota bacterium]